MEVPRIQPATPPEWAQGAAGDHAHLWTYHLKTELISTTVAPATAPALPTPGGCEIGDNKKQRECRDMGCDASFLGVNNGCDKPVCIEQCGFMCGLCRPVCTRKKPRSWCNKPKKACNFMTPNNKCGTANCQKNCDYLCDLCDDPP